MLFLLKSHFILCLFVHKIWVRDFQPITRSLGVLDQLDFVWLASWGSEVDAAVDCVLLLSGETLKSLVKVLQLTVLGGSNWVTGYFLVLDHQLLLTGILTAGLFFNLSFFATPETVRLHLIWSRGLGVVDCYFNLGGGISYLEVETLLHVGFTRSSRVQLRYFDLRWHVICLTSEWVINAWQKRLFSHRRFHLRILTCSFALEEILLFFLVLSWLIVALVS